MQYAPSAVPRREWEAAHGGSLAGTKRACALHPERLDCAGGICSTSLGTPNGNGDTWTGGLGSPFAIGEPSPIPTLQPIVPRLVGILEPFRQIDHQRVAAALLDDPVGLVAGHPVQVGRRYRDAHHVSARRDRLQLRSHLRIGYPLQEGVALLRTHVPLDVLPDHGTVPRGDARTCRPI